MIESMFGYIREWGRQSVCVFVCLRKKRERKSSFTFISPFCVFESRLKYQKAEPIYCKENVLKDTHTHRHKHTHTNTHTHTHTHKDKVFETIFQDNYLLLFIQTKCGELNIAFWFSTIELNCLFFFVWGDIYCFS